MRAVDTNVLARAITRDDPHHAAIADQVLSEGVFVPLTVLLEVGWLFKARYRMSRHQVVAALRGVVDMPAIVIDAAEHVEWALNRLAISGDWSDLLHVVACRGAGPFVTFDRGIAAAAGTDSPVAIETLA